MTPWELKEYASMPPKGRGRKTVERPSDDWGELEAPRGLGFQMIKVGETFEGLILTKPIWQENHPETERVLKYPGRMAMVSGTFWDIEDKTTAMDEEWLQILESLYAEMIPYLEEGQRSLSMKRTGSSTWEVGVYE